MLSLALLEMARYFQPILFSSQIGHGIGMRHSWFDLLSLFLFLAKLGYWYSYFVSLVMNDGNIYNFWTSFLVSKQIGRTWLVSRCTGPSRWWHVSTFGHLSSPWQVDPSFTLNLWKYMYVPGRVHGGVSMC